HGLDAATNDAALFVGAHVVHEGIAGKLLDTQRNALTLGIDRQDNGFQLVALRVLAHGRLARFVPADVAEVDQSVDVAFQSDEDTEIGDRLDVAADTIAL